MSRLPDKEVARSLGALCGVLNLLQDSNLSLTSAQILCYVAAQVIDLERPRAATASELAKSLNKSTSTIIRAMAQMASDKSPLLEGATDAFDARAEAYVLSEHGRNLIEKLIARSIDLSVSIDLPATHNHRTYKKFRQNVERRPQRLRKVSWDEENLTLTVAPAEAVLSDEVQGFVKQFLSAPPDIAALKKEGAVLAFKTAADATYFVMRWC